MSTRDAIESLLERQVTPTQLAHQLMSFFTGRLEISRPELTRLALGLSLSDIDQPQLELKPAAVYEAFKASERSIAIRIRVLFGDGTWRLWASLIRLHAKAPLVDRDLVDCFIRHWERGLVMLRQEWEAVRGTDALLGRLLRKAAEGKATAGTTRLDGPTVTTRPCSWKTLTPAPRLPAETGQIVITTKRLASPLPGSGWRSFTLPTPTRLPLRPFICLPNEQPAQAARRILKRLEITPTRSLRQTFESHLEHQSTIDLEALMHDPKDEDARDGSAIMALARLHLFGSAAGGEAFDLHRQPWSIDLSALSAWRRPLVLRAIALGIETLAHEWHPAQGGDRLRVIVFSDEEASRSLPQKNDRHLGIAWRRLQAAGSSI